MMDALQPTNSVKALKAVQHQTNIYLGKYKNKCKFSKSHMTSHKNKIT